MDLPANQIIHGDCKKTMQQFPDNSIDLTVTSPPYDNLRTYNGFTFDFEGIAKELYRVTKKGGVVVWVVGDATINGSETLTSFKQALFFKEIGFNVHDTMIWHKINPLPLQHNRYQPSFEYMFVFSKEKPKTFNVIKEPVKGIKGGALKKRAKNGEMVSFNSPRGINKEKYRHNIFSYPVGEKSKHPAKFPEKLAEDHIISWSNPGDIVLDPMCGSGTTCKMAAINERKYIGIDISEEYCEIAKKIVSNLQQKLFIV